MTTKKLAKELSGTQWTMSRNATLILSSPEKIGSFTLSGKLPATDGVFDFAAMSVQLVLEVAKFDTGNFMMNMPLRSLISSHLGSHAQWEAQAAAIKVTGPHALDVAGDVEFGDDVLNVPASIDLELVDAEQLTATFSARYIFPHVKLPLPGVPEMWDVPIDLAGALDLQPAG